MEWNTRGIVRVLGFGLWLAAATFAATTLTAWHSVALPQQPGTGAALSRTSGRWRLTHYLSADCACSRAVARYLLARGPVSSATEEVVLVRSSDIPNENSLRDALTRKGFATAILLPETASVDQGVDAVPLLKIHGPDGTQRFRGGYRKRGAAPEEYLDLVVLSNLMDSQPVSALQVLGCATSRQLRALLDPLSLRSLSFPEAQ